MKLGHININKKWRSNGKIGIGRTKYSCLNKTRETGKATTE